MNIENAPPRLLLAPASAGKTAYLIALAREAAQGLQTTPRVVVPTYVQSRAWRRRLAQVGGAIGVRVLTFDRLYAECLNAAGEVYTELSEPVQYRLIRAVVDAMQLEYYAPLKNRPGFIQILQRLFGELKAGRVLPETLLRAMDTAADSLDDAPRLRELAKLYAAYQVQLQRYDWADRAGLGWLAVESLKNRAPLVASDWPLVVVDGFDNFTAVQLDLLAVLAGRVQQFVVTLTGADDGAQRPLVHRRFDKTRARLEEVLGVEAVPLGDFPPLVPPRGREKRVSHKVIFPSFPPEGQETRSSSLRRNVPRTRRVHRSQAGELEGGSTPPVPPLQHMERALFRNKADKVDAGTAVTMIEAPDRAAEVRAALRWLKARVLDEGMDVRDVALLARSIQPYRSFIVQTVAEFGLPVRLLDGLALRINPAIAALLDLLRLALPLTSSQEEGVFEPSLPRRLVIEAWRSPYFDWTARPSADAETAIGIVPGDADALDAVARYGRVMAGLSQWEEALGDLAARGVDAEGAEDEERGMPPGVPVGAAAQTLRDTFRRFVQRITPPQGHCAYRDFVAWLEDLIGPDPSFHTPRSPLPEAPTSLWVVAQARDAAAPIAERDVAALQALKDVLRGLVWAEEALKTPPVDFGGFFEELLGAVEAATYRPPLRPGQSEILVSDVIQARGVPFRAVAILGLGEGEFPTTLREDPFLRDADRAWLRESYGVELEPSTESAEAEFFYEALTRPRECLLLTRPRLADNGAPWQASPYWEEVLRILKVDPVPLTSGSVPVPESVASWPELIESLVVHRAYREVRNWAQQAQPTRWSAVDAATELLHLRRGSPGAGASPGPYDGDLSALSTLFARRFGPRHTWSASRLEAYRVCPFFFFIANVLRLEPKEPPGAGLDARQLGNLYHRILEEVYKAASTSPPTGGTCQDRRCQDEVGRGTCQGAAGRRVGLGTVGGTTSPPTPLSDLREGERVSPPASRVDRCQGAAGLGTRLGFAESDEAKLIEGGEGGIPLATLLALLPTVSKRILDAAPQEEGFRETAWWEQTRAEIVANVRRSLEALANLPGDFMPYAYEPPFGLWGKPPLVVAGEEGDSFRLRGLIDRVDRSPDDRVQVIDYKTAGPYAFTNKAVREGKKLQLPLYALAARDALGLGTPVEGFYWHVQHAEPSSFTLGRFGPDEAIEAAVHYAWEAVLGARAGHFVPHSPDGGCPAYCPAAAFCWHYDPGYGG